jgi:hypothetical protein
MISENQQATEPRVPKDTVLVQQLRDLLERRSLIFPAQIGHNSRRRHIKVEQR